jgi:hypothetical protein
MNNGDGARGDQHSAQLTRRALLQYSALLAVGSCGGGTAKQNKPGTADRARDVFKVWREMKEALAGSPDCLPAEADRIVASKDPDKIFRFVRDNIATIPYSPSELGGADAALWGNRGTLRGASGTLRDKAELLAALYRRAGFTATVMQGEASGGGVVARILRDSKQTLRPTFKPAATAGDYERWRDTLFGKQAAAVRNRRRPTLPSEADCRALGARVLGALPPGAIAERSLDLEPAQPVILPVVSVTVAGETKITHPAFRDLLFGESGLAGPTAPAPEKHKPGAATFELVAVTTTVAAGAAATNAKGGDGQQSLVTLAVDTEHLVGRSLHVAFVPAEDSFASFLRKRPRDLRVFVPALYVSAPDLPVEDRKGFRAVVKALDLDGNVIEARQDGGGSPSGSLTVNGRAVDSRPSAPGVLERVTRLEATADASRFPDVELRIAALDQVGAPVAGLTASAFRVAEAGVAQPALLFENRVRPQRVLFVVDRSDSIPADFRDDGLGRLVADITRRVRAANGESEFKVLVVGGQAPEDRWLRDPDEVARAAAQAPGAGSDLWGALGGAGEIAPSALVFITDGEAEFEPSPADLAKLGPLPAGLFLLVGQQTAAGKATLDRMARLCAGEVIAAANGAQAAETVLAHLERQRRAFYGFRYRAAASGPESREATVSLAQRPATATARYTAPPAADRRAPRRLVGLVLRIKMPGEPAFDRVLAGLPRPMTGAPASVTRDVEAAMFGGTEIRFEGTRPTTAAVLDDVLTERLGYEKTVAALKAKMPKEAADAFLGRPARQSQLAFSLHQNLAADGEFPVCPGGLRGVAVSVLPRYGKGVLVRSDILPIGAHHTPARSARASLEATARATAKLSLLERAFLPRSAARDLDGRMLAAAPANADLDVLFPGLPTFDAERWRWLFEQYGAGFRVVPRDGAPVAFFHIDAGTGAVLAVGDTGAGQGYCENNAGDPDLDRLVNGAEALASLASLMGMTGTAIDVWVDIQITFMRKLIAATIVIAGGTPENDPDIPGEAADRIGEAVEDAVVGGIADAAGVGELYELAGMIGDAAETAQLGACALFG